MPNISICFPLPAEPFPDTMGTKGSLPRPAGRNVKYQGG